MNLKTIFLGNCLPQFLVMLNRTNLQAVFTRQESDDDKIKMIKQICEEKNISVYSPLSMKLEKDKSAYEHIKAINPELIVSGGYHLVVPQEIIDLPKYGTINIHPALLPKYRGQHVIQWQIINNEKKTGTTIHYMTKNLDEGAIIKQADCELTGSDTALDVWQKTADIGSVLLNEVIDDLEKYGKFESRPQDEKAVTTYKSRKPEDGIIDLKKSANDIYNLVRALVRPWPGAMLQVGDTQKIIERVEILSTHDLSPGQIKDENSSIRAGSSDKDLILYFR